ncbi:hypothetical protein [Campylobacter upsaliensis]|uniref:Uncharacterized protein n=1 Tax=Campylobacter upsaliensis TaxID=28080 RepID=A0A381EGL7_CAMUP|nr:hypothetical protein [Campylobacter upsaliensis]MCR2099989.1 hypothetical protein [Campylobacter upsaliensis]MCR2114643.1 hypothetical protein [Campylobacter upsaliensis]MCR2123506.1 hypothetical protein [Campylobacter upsaliensis]SUX25907.1 Uncharacterised protein [Campylobacter upsaliensis]
MIFLISSFNKYFGANPLETLLKFKDETIQNAKHEELPKKEDRERLANSFIDLYISSKEFSDKIGLVEGSIEDKLRKNELSESEKNSLFKWIEENEKIPHQMSIDGVSYDEAYIRIFHTSKSIDEFKSAFLELQKKYEMNFNQEIDQTQQFSQTPQTKNLRTPIQSESQNKETYKDDNAKNELLKKLLENKFGKSEELELLFGMNFSNDNAGEFNKFLSQNTAKSVDIKA